MLLSRTKKTLIPNAASVFPQCYLQIRDLMTSLFVTMSHIHIIHALAASSEELIQRSCSVVVSGAGLGVCELTNQSRPNIQEGGGPLKRQEL